jgi:hypothetical protein
VTVTTTDDGLMVRSDVPLPGATIALTVPAGVSPESMQVMLTGQPLATRISHRWNQPAITVVLDLPAGESRLTVK